MHLITSLIINKDKDPSILAKEVSLLEDNFLLNNNLKKKNKRVFYSKIKDLKLSRQQIFLFRELSIINNQRVSRICLHQSDSSSLHEMIMVHSKPTKIGPLKQNKECISYHIIEGSIAILICDELQNIKNSYLLSSLSFSNEEFNSIRINPNEYRIVSSLSDHAIFLEITNGPFEDNDTIWLNEKKK